jgi:ABC-type Mn2+/Zn2+ transport system ATPase subunit
MPAADALVVRLAAAPAGARPILRETSFSLAAGDVAVVIGPNGSGKSTLLRALLGEVPASLALAAPAPVADLRGLAAYLPQADGVDASFPFTVDELVATARRPRAEEDRLLTATGADGLRGRLLSSLSGGERRRVFVARTLLLRRPVYLLDEPAAAVDRIGAHEIYAAIAERVAEVRAVALVVAHDAAAAEAHAAARLRLGDGTAVFSRLRAAPTAGDATPPALAAFGSRP